MVRRAQLLLVAVAVGWGSIGLVVRRVDLPAVAIAESRVFVGAVGLALWSWVRSVGRHGRVLDERSTASPESGSSARPAGSRGRTVLAGAVLGGHWVALLAAYQRAPIGTVLLIVYVAPVLIAVAAPRVLGERSSTPVLVALVPAIVGAGLVVGPGGAGASISGLVLAAVAAVSWAALALIDKPLARHHGALRLALAKMTVAAVVLAPFALVARWGPPRWAWAWLVVLGLVHTAAGMAAFLWCLSRLPATEVGILAEVEPAAATVLAWVALGERPSAATVAGGLLIVAAGVMVVRAGAGRPQALMPAPDAPPV
ncbi:MAG: DMT family transporter [Actinobacteria bacterium]|nr:DMT family transporter [Actinomycetota bacterium]